MAGSAITGVVKQFTDGLQFVVNFLAKVELGIQLELGNSQDRLERKWDF